jgi:hypothetical protein
MAVRFHVGDAPLSGPVLLRLSFSQFDPEPTSPRTTRNPSEPPYPANSNVVGLSPAIGYLQAWQGHGMKRRDFITALGSAAAWPLAVRAQQPGKARRIGYLTPVAAFNNIDNAFQERLRDLGWIKDQNVTIQYGFMSGRQDRAEPLVAEFLGAGPDVLVTLGATAVARGQAGYGCNPGPSRLSTGEL